MMSQLLAVTQLLEVLEQSSGAVSPDQGRALLAAAEPAPQAARQHKHSMKSDIVTTGRFRFSVGWGMRLNVATTMQSR